MRCLLTVCVALALAADATAQVRAVRIGRDGSVTVVSDPNLFPTMLFQRNDVAQALGLAPEQLARLNVLNQNLQSRFQTDFGNLANVPEAQRLAMQQALNQRFMNSFMTGAGNVLNQAQLSRLQQLQLQSGGFNSLLDPTVQRQLGLNRQQIANLNNVIGQNALLQQGLAGQGMAQSNAQSQLLPQQAQFNNFLTPQQLATLNQMIGQPFNFQPALANQGLFTQTAPIQSAAPPMGSAAPPIQTPTSPIQSPASPIRSPASPIQSLASPIRSTAPATGQGTR